MSEKTTIEVIAPTVEDALSQGLAELGLTAADVSVEVLDSGGKGFLGMGKRQVRIRLTVNETPEADFATQAEDTSAPLVDPAPASVEAAAGAAEADAASPLPASEPEAENKAESEAEEPLLARTEEVVNKLLELMNLEATATARYDTPDREGRKSVYVEITGKDLAVLIGRRGKTIDAFQRIAALIVSKEMARWVRLSIDVEGHRGRREQQLRRMANKVASQVAKTGRKQSLEPMPASERRIVHMALQHHPDVKTNSIGEDPQRKVVIEPK